MAKLFITNQAITEAQQNLGKKNRVELCDTEVPGYYAEVRKTTVSLFFRYKNDGGSNSHIKLGRIGDITIEKARSKAADHRQLVAEGIDPKDTLPKVSITLDEFYQSEYEPHIKVHNRQWKDKANRYNYRIKNEFGDVLLTKITRHSAEKFHAALAEQGLSPATCDHHIVLLRHMLNKAFDWGYIKSNPLTRIKLFHADNRVENILKNEELERFLKVLLSHQDKMPYRMFLLLLLTGARSGEVRACRWEDIDLEKSIWVIPAAVAKSKVKRAIVLNPEAIRLLKSIQDTHDSEYVFANLTTGEPYKCLKKAWATLKKEAGIEIYRIHDLRHQHASIVLNSGKSLDNVQKLLGHTDPSITQRYAHLSHSNLHAASAVVSEQVARLQPENTSRSPKLRLVGKK